MKKGSRSLITFTLVASLIAGPTLFGFATPARADTTSCLAGVVAGILKGKAQKAKAQVKGKIGSTMAVPVHSTSIEALQSANADINANTSGQTQGFTIQRCIVEPMVIIMVRSLLNTFTAQTISWINGGFKGSPLYVTNPQGFLTDIGDQTFGQFINELGPIGKMLCSPFDYQLRLSLNLQFGVGTSGYYQEIGCRLTDIQQNIQRTFTKGDFGKNGWDSWIQLNAYPQNSPYGAYIKSVNVLGSSIAGKQSIATKQLDWGKGFLSSVDPETGKISTPGSLIESNLSKTLGVEVERVGLAKDLDAILNALANQLINQVLGPGGLLGATKSPSGGGGRSPVERALNMTPGAIVASNAESQTLPDGLLTFDEVKGTYMGVGAFCEAFKNNLYFVDVNDKKVWAQVGTVGADGKLVYGDKVISYKSAVINGKTELVSWTVDDYNAVSNYCKNYSITAPVTEATKAYTDTVDEENDRDLGIPDIIEDEVVVTNLALNKPTRQSSTYTNWRYYPESSIAVDGQKTGNENYGLALTQNQADEWWQVDLESVQNIDSVRIYRTANGVWFNYPFYIFVTTTDMGDATTNDLLTDNSGSVVAKIRSDANEIFGNRGSNNALIPVHASGQYVRVAKYWSDSHIGLAEVEVIPAGGNTNRAGASVVPLSFSQTNPEALKIVRLQEFSDEFVLTAGKDLAGLKARIKIVSASRQTQQFPVFFSSLSVTMAFPEGDYGVDLLVKPSYCRSICTKIVNPDLGPTYGGAITINKDTFSMRAGESFKVKLTGIAPNTAFGTQKMILEVFDSQNTVLATYEKTVQI
ncbi:MAG: hypothetical protein NUV54_01475 [Candidatus Taylorbacteria bacterium]|nr:hypothetical protein [Candidatus Taylorbacteria bacterium]